MSTGALPTPQQQLPAQLAQHHQTPPPPPALPQTPHVQHSQPVSTQQQQQPPVPMQQQLQGHAQYQVQQFFHQRQRMMMYHQQQQAAAAAAAAARSGAAIPPQVTGVHQLQVAQQQLPPQQQLPTSGVGMAAVQQEMSPQPAALPNGQPNTKPGVLPPSSMQQQHQQQKPAFVMEPQRLQSSGQAVLRLLEFADMISPGEQATAPAFWYQFVDDFFTTPSMLKMDLWSTQKNTHETYELDRPTIARFFLQQYTCQVSSIQMTLERLNETFKK